MNPILEIHNCSLAFGGIKAVTNFTAHLLETECLGVIGPNGAGKTTLFNLLTGVYSPNKGEILFKKREIHGLPLYQINRLGIARTFQNIRLFEQLTVLENVQTAFHCRAQSTLWKSFWNGKKIQTEKKIFQEEAEKILSFLNLKDQKNRISKELCYGDRRRLEIARALATKPEILLLDEPAAGMNSTEKNNLIEMIREAQKEYKLSILLIEHDMEVVMNLCPRIIVMDYGEILAEGSPEEIRKNEKVVEAYLGTHENNSTN